MSEELLSAMLDGECTPHELETLLAALERSPELRARWSRMCLTRDAMAGTRVPAARPDFTASVMAAIQAESAATEVVQPKVVPLRRAAPLVVQRGRRRWQPLAGLAAAASIAAVVVVGGRGLLERPVGVAATQTAADQRGAQVTPTQVASQISTAEPAETRWTQLDAASARQLNDYLMEHSNSRVESGMGGALSHARLTVRTADYRPAEEPR